MVFESKFRFLKKWHGSKKRSNTIVVFNPTYCDEEAAFDEYNLLSQQRKLRAVFQATKNFLLNRAGSSGFFVH